MDAALAEAMRKAAEKDVAKAEKHATIAHYSRS